jgi:uncharacterized protein (DUF1778 family)
MDLVHKCGILPGSQWKSLMPTETPEIRVTDSKARLTLPRSFANSTVLIEVRNENEIVIRKAKVIPLTEEPETITLSKVDWDRFVELLENPPAPTEALKALMTEDGPKGDNRAFTVAE